MTSLKKITIALSILIAGVLFFACSKSSSGDTNTPTPDPGFDKAAMLTGYADQLIIPAYNSLQQKMTALQTASAAFTAAPSATTQQSLKEAYTATRLQYAHVEAFNFGPAAVELLDAFGNFAGGLDYNFTTDGELTGYSVDSVLIEKNISSGNYDLTVYSRNSCYAQGFPALEYLYFGPDAVAKFSANTAARTKYVKDVTDRLKSIIDKVVSSWASYRSSFIANTKSDVGSPIGNIVNQLAYQMDMLKGPRIGWPFGKQSNGTVFASKSEAYYSGLSGQLAVENLTSLKTFFTNASGSKGISAYLVALKKETLNTDVLAQFDVTIAKLQAIPSPLSASFSEHAADVDNAYKEIQKLLTLLKTDVASATGVQISFMDNDGD